MQSNEPVVSPCIGVCELNSEEICLGCGRSLQDIAAWSAASESTRAVIVQQAHARLQHIQASDALAGSAV